MATVAGGITFRGLGLLVGTDPGTGVAFPGGSVISRIKVLSVALTPAATGATTAAEQTATLAGLAADDKVFGWFASTPNTTNVVTISNVRVTAGNTIGVTYVNPTAGSLTYPAYTINVLVYNIDTA